MCPLKVLGLALNQQINRYFLGEIDNKYRKFVLKNGFWKMCFENCAMTEKLFLCNFRFEFQKFSVKHHTNEHFQHFIYKHIIGEYCELNEIASLIVFWSVFTSMRSLFELLWTRGESGDKWKTARRKTLSVINIFTKRVRNWINVVNSHWFLITVKCEKILFLNNDAVEMNYLQSPTDIPWCFFPMFLFVIPVFTFPEEKWSFSAFF